MNGCVSECAYSACIEVCGVSLGDYCGIELMLFAVFSKLRAVLVMNISVKFIFARRCVTDRNRNIGYLVERIVKIT